MKNSGLFYIIKGIFYKVNINKTNPLRIFLLVIFNFKKQSKIRIIIYTPIRQNYAICSNKNFSKKI